MLRRIYMQPIQNQMKDFLTGTNGDRKLSKEAELTTEMSISAQGADEYTRKIKNIGGNN